MGGSDHFSLTSVDLFFWFAVLYYGKVYWLKVQYLEKIYLIESILIYTITTTYYKNLLSLLPYIYEYILYVYYRKLPYSPIMVVQ